MMGVSVICMVCGAETYYPHIRTTDKKKLFEWGCWDCCDFARMQYYVDKPKLKFYAVKR